MSHVNYLPRVGYLSILALIIPLLSLFYLFNNNSEMMRFNFAALIILIAFPVFGLIFKSTNESLINYIPGFCTSIGIAITFMVLYFTLSKGTELKSVNELIMQLSVKFSASLIGIYYSIIYSIYIKLFKPFIQLENEWQQKSPEEVLYELTKLTIQNNKILDGVKNKFDLFGTEVLVSIFEIRKHLDTISNEFSQINENFKNSLDEITNELKTHLGDSLVKVGIDSHQVLGSKILEIQESFSGIINQKMDIFHAQSEENVNTTKDIFEKLKDAVVEMTLDLKTQQELQVNDSKNNIEAINKSFESTTSSINLHLSEQSEQLRDKFEKASEGLSNLDKNLILAGEEIFKKGMVHMEKSMEQLDRSFDNMSELQNRHLTFLDTITRLFAESSEKYASLSIKHEEVLDILNLETTKMVDLTNSSNELVHSISTKIEHINNLFTVMVNAVNQLQNENNTNN